MNKIYTLCLEFNKGPLCVTHNWAKLYQIEKFWNVT